MVPIMFGAKYHFLDGIPELYGSGELGINIAIFSIKYSGPSSTIWGPDPNDSDSSAEFTFSPSIGYILKTGDHTFDFSFGFRWVDMGDLTYLGLRVAYYLPVKF